MSNVLCVTNRHLCGTEFSEQIEKIAKAHPAGIILREKDLSEAEYKNLAENVMSICKTYDVPCILHSFVDVSIELKCEAIHLPLHRLLELTEEEKARFSVIGASCHSVEDAVAAEKSGCTYITAGHVFDTDCKKGLPGRGIDFLKKICDSVSIPVYAIGGICPENISAVLRAGAKGVCVMSSVMKCEEPGELLQEFSRIRRKSG